MTKSDKLVKRFTCTSFEKVFSYLTDFVIHLNLPIKSIDKSKITVENLSYKTLNSHCDSKTNFEWKVANLIIFFIQNWSTALY